MNQHLDRLDGLHGCIQRPAALLIERCEAVLKRKLMVVHGWRAVAEQALIYQKGRTFNRETGEWEITEPALVVTNAKPGLSAHNVITRTGETAALGLDVIPLDANGQPEWDVDENFWDKLYEIAWKCGLDPLGDPIGSYLASDKGHFEEPCWKLKLDGLKLIQPVAA